MIYTVTINPSLDLTIEVDEFLYDDVNVVLKEQRRVGGKGIDVSRVIRNLGGQSIVLGFAGGYGGIEVEGRLINDGLTCDLTRINGGTKVNVMIHQRKKKTRTALNFPGEAVTPLDIATFHSRIKQIHKNSLVVLTGDLRPGLNDGLYAQMITTLKVRHVKVLFDSDGEMFKMGVAAGPFLIKPNIHEFGRLVGKKIKDYHHVLENVEPLLSRAEYVVVSMGAKGVVGISRKERYLVVPPRVNVKSSTGAGDALLAGIAFGLSEGYDFKEALLLGVACGTASTLYGDSALCLQEDMERIKSEITIKNI